MRVKGTLYFLLVSMFVSGCTKHQVPITKRNQLMLLSKDDEVKMGRKNFKGMVNRSKISKDVEKKEMLNRVGQKLASTVKRRKFNWEFILVENDVINASCFPGGKVIINSGVFKVAKTDAQLATILSHEMAHALSRHGSARISRERILNTLEGAGAILAGVVNPMMIVPFLLAYETGTKHSIVNPTIRIEENEADLIGLFLMHKANYDLNEALDFWNNLKTYNLNKKHKKNSTHSSYDKRIKNIQKTIDKIKNKNI